MRYVTKKYTARRISGGNTHVSFSTILSVPSYTLGDTTVAFTLENKLSVPHHREISNPVIYAHENKLYRHLAPFGKKEKYDNINDYLTNRAKLNKQEIQNGVHPLTDFIFVDGNRCDRVTEPYYALKSNKSGKRKIIVTTKNLVAPYISRFRYKKSFGGELAFNALCLDDVKLVFPDLGSKVKFEQEIIIHLPSMVKLLGLEINDPSFIYTKSLIKSR